MFQRTLNPRVRGSSPWRRTRTGLAFWPSFYPGSGPFSGRGCSTFARQSGSGRPGRDSMPGLAPADGCTQRDIWPKSQWKACRDGGRTPDRRGWRHGLPRLCCGPDGRAAPMTMPSQRRARARPGSTCWPGGRLPSVWVGRPMRVTAMPSRNWTVKPMTMCGPGAALAGLAGCQLIASAGRAALTASSRRARP